MRKNKIRIFMAVLVLVVGLTITTAGAHWLQDITVKLPTGTWFYIGGERILTVAHLIKPYMENAIWVINGEHETTARLIKIDRERDLALLRVDEAKYPEMLLKLETEIDEEIISVVNFGDFEDILLRGRIAGYGYYEGKEYIVIDMTIIPGMSGSGVFSEGKLIGMIKIVYGSQRIGDFVALIIPAERIKEFLEE